NDRPKSNGQTNQDYPQNATCSKNNKKSSHRDRVSSLMTRSLAAQGYNAIRDIFSLWPNLPVRFAWEGANRAVRAGRACPRMLRLSLTRVYERPFRILFSWKLFKQLMRLL